MSMMPDKLLKAWDDRNGAVVLTTVDSAGVPNAIYATCVGCLNNSTLVVADNYFHKTRHNLKAGGRGSILFRTGDGTAYQVKGSLSYHTSGPVFEFMKSWNPAKHPGHAAAALAVTEAFSGAERLL